MRQYICWDVSIGELTEAYRLALERQAQDLHYVQIDKWDYRMLFWVPADVVIAGTYKYETAKRR